MTSFDRKERKLKARENKKAALVRRKERRRNQFKSGDKIHHFTLIQRIRAPKGVVGYRKKQWRVECECGKRMSLPEYYLKRKENPRTSCGCIRKTVKTEFNREYRIWCMMRQRCYFETHDAYKHYGGRGIQIHDTWLSPAEGGDEEGFQRFFDHIGPAPSKKYSIDRIDVNGNYEPGNVRWATAKEQANNKRTPEQVAADLAAQEVDEDDDDDV